MKLGLVGLPLSGKSTLFDALRGDKPASEIQKPSTARIVNVTVPDERVDFLAAQLSPKKITYASIDYVDVPGVLADTSRKENARILAALREVDALVHVVRMFESKAAPHPRSSIDPMRDIREIENELCIGDLEIAEGRVEKLRISVNKPTPKQKEEREELEVLERCLAALEEGKKVASVQLTEHEETLIKNFCFLSQKPQVLVLNIGEEQLSLEGVKDAVKEWSGEVLVMCAQLEMEIATLDPEDQKAFMKEMSIVEPAGDRLKTASYRLLKLCSFFTTASDELRAWTIPEGATAVEAAGKVHTDIARGFIRAEVVSFEDFKESGSIKEARAHGKLRLEGKEYTVHDGDIVFFRFSV